MATKKWHFRTPIDEPVKTVTPAGSKEEDVWALRINDKGEEEFYIKGKTNVYEKIQAYAKECDIETILRKFTDTGDITILEKGHPIYADISDMPDNIFEAHQKIKEAEETFNNLPVELRKKYDFNFNKYLADFGSETWIKNMGLNNPDPKEETPKEEIKKGESEE